MVRVTREQAAANREKILEVAGALFRERGFDGIGVADIMKRAGLTHGGFYGHFASKDDLAAEITARVLGRSGWMERLTETERPSVADVCDSICRHGIATTLAAAACSPHSGRMSSVSRALCVVLSPRDCASASTRSAD